MRDDREITILSDGSLRVSETSLEGRRLTFRVQAEWAAQWLEDHHDENGLTDLAHDDGTDSVVRTRIYFALQRARIPLSMPAHAIFMTEDTGKRKERKHMTPVVYLTSSTPRSRPKNK